MRAPNFEKIESLINQIDETSVIDRKHIHDIHAQIINIKGFVNELTRSVGEVQSELAHTQPPSKNVERISEIIATDILPCLEFIERSSTKLDEDITNIFEPPDC